MYPVAFFEERCNGHNDSQTAMLMFFPYSFFMNEQKSAKIYLNGSSFFIVLGLSRALKNS